MANRESTSSNLNSCGKNQYTFFRAVSEGEKHKLASKWLEQPYIPTTFKSSLNPVFCPFRAHRKQRDKVNNS